ncbi:MAG TPA: cytochrome c, partial [Burkholderiaceae bacterium]
LDAAAKSGNLDAIKAAFGDAGKTCKACHDNFREK